MVDVGNALLEIHARPNGAQHLITRAEHAFEQLKLLGQQFIDAFVGFILSVQEIHHHYVMLLSVAMTAADALLDALRVPGQIVVDYEGTELQVNAFRSGFGGNHDAALFAEVIHQSRAHVGSLGTGQPISALVLFQPGGVDLFGTLIGV